MRADRVLLGAIAVASVFLVIVLGIGISSSDDGADALDGTSWRLEALLVDGQEVPIVEGTSPSITFDDGVARGSGGCNNFSGAYESEGDTISIGPLAVTEMFCDDPAGTFDQEMAFLARLAAASTFRVDAGRLVLNDDSAELLRFNAA